MLLLAGLWAVEAFVSPSVSLSERVKRHILHASPLDLMTPQSGVLLEESSARDFLGALEKGDFSSSSLWVADVGEAYKSSGVPIWVPLVAATALALTLASPVIARSLQRKANTRRLDTSFPPEDGKL